jgi:CheY-like chemotaxis protein
VQARITSFTVHPFTRSPVHLVTPSPLHLFTPSPADAKAKNTRRKHLSLNHLPAPGLFFAAHTSSWRDGTEHQRKGTGVDGANGKTTILVVDDNSDNVEILRAFLESRGFTVAEARDGRTALARMEEVRPDLVLLDVMMPGMDGWEVCRVIKQHPQLGDTKVVMVTAKGGFEDKMEGLRSRADDYVVKPVDFKELMEKVTRNLAARGSQA